MQDGKDVMHGGCDSETVDDCMYAKCIEGLGDVSMTVDSLAYSHCQLDDVRAQ